jgi:hypothetical protein
MTRVIERTAGHYKVQETSYGEAYVWCPACVVVECDCGERLVLSASETVCGCGADHVILVRVELAVRSPSDGTSHPWEAEYYEWRKEQDEYLRAEHHDWMEWRVIE